MSVTANSKKGARLRFPQEVRRNFDLIKEAMHFNEHQIGIELPLLEDEPNERNSTFISKYCPLIKQLLLNIEDPFKCVLIMPQLLKGSAQISAIDSDRVFEGTMFHQSLRPTLTTYLHSQTPFLQLRQNSSRVADVFYKYLLYQENTLMEITLQSLQTQDNTIGNWLLKEGINSMFKRYYSESAPYTIFINNFMYYGIGYLFLAATRILKNDIRAIKHSDVPQDLLENIQIAYVKKYRLDCLFQNMTETQ